MQDNLDHPHRNVSHRRLTISRIFYLSLLFTILSLAADWCVSQDEKIAEKTGVFESPNYPRNYSHNLHETLEISFPALTIVRLEFLTFTLEDTGDYCKGDYVAIYKGLAENVNGLVKKKLCGKMDPSLRTIVTDPVYDLLIIFHTDDSETAEGFRLNYTATMVDSDLACELMIRVNGETETAEISSLFVGNQEGNVRRYPNRIDCSWIIETNISYEMSLEVNLLPDMVGEDCTHNFIEVRVPVNDSSNITSWELTLRDNDTDLWFPKVAPSKSATTDEISLERVCGNRAHPLGFKTNAKRIKVIFHSDFAIENGYFRVIYRPINSTRQAKTTQIQNITLHERSSFTINPDVDIPYQIPTSGVTIDTITWTIQTIPGFIIRYDILSTKNTEVPVYAFDSPTTDPNRRLKTENELTDTKKAFSSGFYLSLLCMSSSQTCPQVKYTFLNVFTDTSHPFHVRHKKRYFDLFEHYNLIGQCCTYAQFTRRDIEYQYRYTRLQISEVSKVSVLTNADNCRNFGIMIYDGILSNEHQHGPFCEMFSGNIKFMLNNFLANSPTMFVVVYMYGDVGPDVYTDVPVISFTVHNAHIPLAGPCLRLYSLTPGPRILDYKDNVTTPINPRPTTDYYSCATFFLTGQVITDNQTVRLRFGSHYRSWSVLCANSSDFADSVPYVYIYNGEDFILHAYNEGHVNWTDYQSRSAIITPSSWKLGSHCDHPLLIHYYVHSANKPVVHLYGNHSNPRDPFGMLPLTLLVLISDQRHHGNCYWSITASCLGGFRCQWRLMTHQFSVRKGSGRASLDRLKITQLENGAVTTFTNVRHPREYIIPGADRSEAILDIHASSDYHLNIRMYLMREYIEPVESCTGETCYLIRRNDSISWTDANQDCRSEEGGQLLYVKSIQELEHIKQLLVQKRTSGLTFIGITGTNVARDGYRWTDGSPVIYTDWNHPFDDMYNSTSLPVYPVTDFPSGKIQPLADLDKGCVAMMVGNPLYSMKWWKIPCAKRFQNAKYICKVVSTENTTKRETLMSNMSCPEYQFRCDDGSCVIPASRCNRKDDCLYGEDENGCSYGDNIFTCESGTGIHVSLCCDGRNDCDDNSDEKGCLLEDCFRCSTGFCLPNDKRCDGIIDCPDPGVDELSCTEGDLCRTYRCPSGECILPHKLFDMVPDCAGFNQLDETYDFDLGKSNLSWIVKNGKPEEYKYGNTPCPLGDKERRCHLEHTRCYPRDKTCMYDRDHYGHLLYCRNGEHLWDQSCREHLCPNMYKCPDAYCIPYIRVCDDTSDCPDLSDEADCENYTCPGLFRCRENLCLSQNEVCDGTAHCPKSADDERFCEFNRPNVTTCPTSCLCEGYHVDCSGKNLSSIPENVPENARTLILHSNALDNVFEGLSFKYLVIFDLSNNNVTEIGGLTFRDMYNLHHLRLHHNSLSLLGKSIFANLSRLKILEIQFNPISHLDVGVFSDLASLVILNMSNMDIETIPVDLFTGLVSLKVLDLAVNRITVVITGSLSKFVELAVLNITNNTLEKIETDSFKGLDVDHLLTDDHRFCCYVDHNTVETCSPAESLTFSCDHLLASHAHKALVWIIGVSAFVGNIVVLVRRLRDGLGKVPSILIFNLSISDMLMGIFLLIIASTDLVYLGDYALEDPIWRGSLPCQVAGFLATVSNGMSMMMIVFIAVDRAMKVIPTFGRVPNNLKRSIIAIVVGWLTIVCLGLLPFLPVGLGDFYGRTEICAPFIFKDLSGAALYYAMAFFVVPNCLALIVVTVSYVAIYISVKRSGEASGRKDKYEVDLAKKFGLIIFTDFCTWLPVLLSVVAFQVHSPLRPDESSTVALIILPLNSALNPYLYPFKSSKQLKKD